MKRKNNYFLLRHGQTVYQEEKKEFNYPNPEVPPVSITDKGEKQVRESVEKLKDKHIDLIFSSDFFRTQQTARIAAQILDIKEINLDERLRDIDIGKFHGGPKIDYQNFFSEKRERFSKRPPNGENWQDVIRRLSSFLEEIEAKYQNKNILIISHGDPLWLSAGILKGLKTEKEFIESRENKEFYPQAGQLIVI